MERKERVEGKENKAEQSKAKERKVKEGGENVQRRTAALKISVAAVQAGT
jgi:hypothetical protein